MQINVRLVATATACEVVPQQAVAEGSPFQFLSDHKGVMATFRHQPPRAGRGRAVKAP